MLGYIGAFFLICRLLPVVYEAYATDKQINLYFLSLEGFACIFLGLKSLELHAYPFIIANGCSLLSILLIFGIYLHKRQRRSNDSVNVV